MTHTVVHLLRHGEVENPDRILYGRIPGYGLSAAGRGMAVRAAEALRGRDIARLFCSPLQRAEETAAPVSAVTGLDIETDDRLIEPSNAFQGMRFGVGDGAWRRPGNWLKLYNPFKPSWGEPYAEVATRMRAAVQAARDAARGREAVCVSHQLPIWVLRLSYEGHRLWHDPRKRQCSLASLTSLTFDDAELIAIDYTEPAGTTSSDAARGA